LCSYGSILGGGAPALVKESSEDKESSEYAVRTYVPLYINWLFQLLFGAAIAARLVRKGHNYANGVSGFEHTLWFFSSLLFGAITQVLLSPSPGKEAGDGLISLLLALVPGFLSLYLLYWAFRRSEDHIQFSRAVLSDALKSAMSQIDTLAFTALFGCVVAVSAGVAALIIGPGPAASSLSNFTLSLLALVDLTRQATSIEIVEKSAVWAALQFRKLSKSGGGGGGKGATTNKSNSLGNEKGEGGENGNGNEDNEDLNDGDDEDLLPTPVVARQAQAAASGTMNMSLRDALKSSRSSSSFRSSSAALSEEEEDLISSGGTRTRFSTPSGKSEPLQPSNSNSVSSGGAKRTNNNGAATNTGVTAAAKFFSVTASSKAQWAF